MPLLDDIKKPMKPAEFAEHKILEAILDSSYESGEALPAERVLAKSLGVTRPTLREALQRLAKEGWVSIAHGKPTQVNDYLSQGGLGVLTTLARYGEHLSHDMIDHLLETRTLIFPGIAQKAVEKDPAAILEYLETELPEEVDAALFARFDWGLQTLMVNVIRNPVLKMMFNDFAAMYHLLGARYFSLEEAQKNTLAYYQKLKSAIQKGDTDIQMLVEETMGDVRKVWERVS